MRRIETEINWYELRTERSDYLQIRRVFRQINESYIELSLKLCGIGKFRRLKDSLSFTTPKPANPLRI